MSFFTDFQIWVKNIAKNTLSSLQLSFWLVLIVVLVFEFFFIKDSALIFFKTFQAEAPKTTDHQVKIDIDSYKWSIKRIEKASLFLPDNSKTRNVFKNAEGN